MVVVVMVEDGSFAQRNRGRRGEKVCDECSSSAAEQTQLCSILLVKPLDRVLRCRTIL